MSLTILATFAAVELILGCAWVYRKRRGDYAGQRNLWPAGRVGAL